MVVENLHEAGHVRTLEIMWQVDVHVEIGDCMLHMTGAVLDLDGVANVLDTDLVDMDRTVITAALHVHHVRGVGRFCVDCVTHVIHSLHCSEHRLDLFPTRLLLLP